MRGRRLLFIIFVVGCFLYVSIATFVLLCVRSFPLLFFVANNKEEEQVSHYFV